MFSVAGCIFFMQVHKLEIKFFWGVVFFFFLSFSALWVFTGSNNPRSLHSQSIKCGLYARKLHFWTEWFIYAGKMFVLKYSFVGPQQRVCEYLVYPENISSLWNVETIAPELLFAARLKYLFVALAFSAWQKRPAASTTAGMATIRAFQNGSRWSCQKRKQQKICLVTELHRRAGNPPEAPTEPLAYYPSLFTSFLHSFFIITAPLISLFPDYKVFILIR